MQPSPDPGGPSRTVGFWEGPLGYRQSVLVVATALLIGVFFHFRVGDALMPGPDFAGWALVGLGLAVLLGRRYRDSRVYAWLSGLPFGVVATSATLLVATAGGLFPAAEFERRFGVESVFGSWPFILVAGLLVVNLVSSTIRRMWPMSRENVQYALIHGGLALALIAGAQGSLGLERLSLPLEIGKASDLAAGTQGAPVRLPFRTTLIDFELEVFPPTLAIARVAPEDDNHLHLTSGESLVRKGLVESIDGYRLEVLEFLPEAAYTGEKWVAFASRTSAPAAKVSVSTPNGDKKVGWISCGSVEVPPFLIELDESTAVALSVPRPKAFRSRVRIELNGKTREETIEVNRPLAVAGRTVYQLSYDERLGRASQTSVLEVVRDPAVPAVYAGLLAMLAGVFLFMATGIRRRP